MKPRTQAEWDELLSSEGMAPLEDEQGRVMQRVYSGPVQCDHRYERLAEALATNRLSVLAPQHREAAESPRLRCRRRKDIAVCRLLAEGHDVAGRDHPERHSRYKAAQRLKLWTAAMRDDDARSEPVTETTAIEVLEIFAGAQRHR